MRSLASRLARNASLKLAALALAVVLWTAVRIESPVRQNVTSVPVEVELEDPTWALSGAPLPSVVAVRVNGTTRDLLRLANDRPRIVIPIVDVGGADSSLAIQRDWVQFAEGAGVQVEAIQPGSVHLTFERKSSVTLPFEITTRGEPGDDLALSAALVPSPAQGTVTGTRSALEGHQVIGLEPLDLSGVTRAGVYAVRFDTTRMAGLQVQPEVVEVAVRLDSAVQRVFPAVPVELEGPLEGARPEPEVVTVSVWGASSLLADLDAEGVRAVARMEADSLPAEGDIVVGLDVEGLPQPSRATLDVDSVRVRRITATRP